MERFVMGRLVLWENWWVGRFRRRYCMSRRINWISCDKEQRWRATCVHDRDSGTNK
jgi:hypothetical protein